MKKTKIINIIEYLSATLVFSYFFVHNIFLVLIGITFSLYLINIKYLNNFIRSTNKNLDIKKSITGLNNNDKLKKPISINIASHKEDIKLSLVETIEELGFIPSIDKNDEIDAA